MAKAKALAAACALACAAVASGGEPGGVDDWNRIYLGSNPSVAGDGRRFVFEWNDSIWIADTRGVYARRLGNGRSSDSWPVISADGEKVAFASDSDGGCKVFELDIARGTMRQITFHSEATWPRSWCPDGRLLCSGWRDGSGPNACGRALYVRTDARKAEEVAFDLPALDPVMSPDGTSILFMRRGDDLYRKRLHSTTPAAGQIWRYTVATGEFDAMVAHETDCRSPQWLPDGSGFYYLDAKGGVRNVWRHDIATGAGTQLTFFEDEHVSQPSLSADGRTMVFRKGFDFWRFDPTSGGKPERIVLLPEVGYVPRGASRRRRYESCWNNDADGDVAFCDNGTQVAFTTGGDLYVMDTVICEPTLVHGETATHERECAFSPDGRALYYLSDRGDTSRVMRAEPEDPSKPWWENSSFRRTVLVDDVAARQGFTVSPDGSRLAWHDPSGVFVFSDTNGVQISRGPMATDAGMYAWSPDGRWIAAQLADEFGNSDVWIVSADGSSKPYNLSRNFKYDGQPAWSPDGKVIAFVSELPEVGNGTYLRYVYLDKASEEAETYVYEMDKSRRTIRDGASDKERYAALELPSERLKGGEGFTIDFEGLAERVRTVSVSASVPFFKWDSRTVAYAAGNRTDFIHIPDEPSGRQLFPCTGAPRAWIRCGDEDRVLWVVGRLPAIGQRKLGFTVYQSTDYADYQELAFRTAWARVRDLYYDRDTHGVNWPAVGGRLLAPARNATSYSVFNRVMQMMLGELDSSHLGFYQSDNSVREWGRKGANSGWTMQTAHLGLRFGAPEPDGWLVRDVIPDGPADRIEIGIAAGDVVTAVDGTPVGGDMDPTQVLNGPPGRKVRITFRRKRDGETKTAVIESFGYSEARSLVASEEMRAKRRFVHERSGDRLGYLNVDAMNWKTLYVFQHEVFSEGYGRDGLIIDVRNNTGGFTADQMLQILMGADHSRSVTRTCGAGYLFGYWQRPVWSKPIVVLCNENTVSNGEIFSHAIKTLKRGKLVGRETNGGVIGTNDRDLLDLGKFRDARYGWFVLDGTDMEWNGAKPDFEVDNLPGEVVKGIDRQLEKAIEVLAGEVEEWRKSNPEVELKFSK